ncbi:MULTISPECIES: cupin domain-containing protein [unclassified Sphingomonas]|uniref:cupin domain-containing protein n=1 Tax=Novosphingobium rhizosphaerae TaxID=1551649 RepID=UPI0015C86A00
MEQETLLKGYLNEGRREGVVLPATTGPLKTIVGFGEIRMRVARYQDEYASFSVVEMELGQGESVPRHTNTLNERTLICYGGEGVVKGGGKDTPFKQGGSLFVSRGAYVEIIQQGAEPLRFTTISLVPDAAAADDLFPLNLKGLVIGDGADAPGAQVLLEQEEEGFQYWQAAPSLGYITMKFEEEMPHDYYFSISSQTLDPGSQVRHHGHVKSTEVAVCTRGRGRAVIFDTELEYGLGDLLIFPPTVTHHFINDSGEPWTYTGIFTPRSVEDALRKTGVRKLPGMERPVDIPRNPQTERMLVEEYGFIIPGIS